MKALEEQVKQQGHQHDKAEQDLAAQIASLGERLQALENKQQVANLGASGPDSDKILKALEQI